MNCERCEKRGIEVLGTIKIREYKNGKFGSIEKCLCKSCIAKFKKLIPENEKYGFTYEIMLNKVKVILV